MKIEELLRINSGLKRRLIDKPHKSKTLLHSSKKQDVVANFCSVDILHVVTLNSEPERLRDPKKCFYTDLRKNGKQFITKEEANIILGYDYPTAVEDEDIQAMLEAAEGGIGSFYANAYFLGGSYNKARGASTIPVVYFKIPNKIHRSLSINPKDKEFREVIKTLTN